MREVIGLPMVTLNRAPGRGINLGKGRSSGIILSKPATAQRNLVLYLDTHLNTPETHMGMTSGITVESMMILPLRV